MSTSPADRLLAIPVRNTDALRHRWSTTTLFLAAVIAVDVLLVLVTVFSELYPETLIVRRFNLSVEHTLGVWWSSMTLALAAVLIATGRLGGSAARLGGYVAALLLLGLSLDELASLHERAPAEGRLLVLFPFALGGTAMLLYTLAKWWPAPATRGAAILFGLGFVCFGSVVGQEILEHAVTWPEWALGLRVGVEEGIELLGIFLCLLAGIRLRAPVAETPPAESPFRVIEVPRLALLASLGLVAHALAAVVSPALGGYPSLGNPAMWFPTVAYGLAAAALLDRQLRGGRVMLVPAVLLVAFAGLSAVHAVFIFPDSAVDKLLWRNALGAALGLGLTLAAGAAPGRTLARYLVALLALAAWWVTGTTEAAFLASGAVAWASLLTVTDASFDAPATSSSTAAGEPLATR